MEDGGGRRKACARCHVRKKKCQRGCRFAPYFPAGQREKFAIVDKFFGATKVIEALEDLPEDRRVEALDGMVYEAKARARDPVKGCFGEITTLKNQLADSIAEVEHLKRLLASHQSNRNPSPASLGNSGLPS